MRKLVSCFYRVFVLISLVVVEHFLSFGAFAQGVETPLSAEAVFYRCYGQMTRRRPAANDPLLSQVRAQTLSPIDACMQVLLKGSLIQQGSSAAYLLANPNDSEQQAVLKTFLDFFRGWFKPPQLPDQIYTDIEHQYDDQAFLGYFLYALFGPQVPYTSVVTEPRALRLRRAENHIVMQSNQNWYSSARIQQGVIRGMEFYPPGSVSWWTLIPQSGSGGGLEQTQVTMRYSPYTTFSTKRSFGGGFMGDAAFIWYHIGYPFMRDTSDGGERLPRRMARDILSGLLCRDIPLMRTTDVTQLVAENINKFGQNSTQPPFRQNSQCMSCHAGLDPMGEAWRNVQFKETDLNPTLSNEQRQRHIYMRSNAQLLPTTPDELEGFHLKPPDSNDYRRFPSFGISYRDYDGTFVEERHSATDIEDALSKLGSSLTQKDAFYMCAASRFYEFFTGIKVNLLDYQDPRNGGIITDADFHYRATTKVLADSLRNHQSLKQLVREIFELPQYSTVGNRDLKS